MSQLTVDIQPDVLAGGDVVHANCQSVLLEAGNEQENIQMKISRLLIDAAVFGEHKAKTEQREK